MAQHVQSKPGSDVQMRSRTNIVTFGVDLATVYGGYTFANEVSFAKRSQIIPTLTHHAHPYVSSGFITICQQKPEVDGFLEYF